MGQTGVGRKVSEGEFTVMVPPGPGEWLSSVGILTGGHRTPETTRGW